MRSTAPASSSTSSSSPSFDGILLPASPDGVTALMAHISHLGLPELDRILAKLDASSTGDASFTDDELALIFFAKEAEGLLRLAKDHVLGAMYDHSDGSDDLLDELLSTEETAEYDRAVALALSQERDPPPRPPPRGRQRPVVYGPISRAVTPPRDVNPSPERRDVRTFGPIEEDRGRSSIRFPSPARSGSPPYRPLLPLQFPIGFDPATPPRSTSPPGQRELPLRANVPEFHQRLPTPNGRGRSGPRPRTPAGAPRPRTPIPVCTICQEVIEETIIYTRCGHFLDVPCIRTMFENAIKDESLFPPKCCQEPLEFDNISEYLSASLRAQYKRKTREYRTKDRVYCHKPTCAVFLAGATAAPTSLPCTECGSETCGCCKERAHRDRACKARGDLDGAMLDLAKEQGWQRCPSCRHIVERTEGCYHMTCRCEKEFCYLCAATWKTCACPRFMDVPDEEGLVHLAP